MPSEDEHRFKDVLERAQFERQTAIWAVTWGEPFDPSAPRRQRSLLERLNSQLRWRVSEALIEAVAEIDWCARKLEALGSWADRLALRIRWGDDA